VELLLPIQGRLEAAALLCEDVQQHGMVLRLEELERLHQQRKVVPVNGAEVLQPELLEEDGGPEHAFGGLFSAAHHLGGGFAAKALDELRGSLVEVLVVLVGDDAVQVARHGAYVAVNGPLVVIEHDDQALGLLGDVVERLVRDPIGECRIAGDGHHMLTAACQVARHGHAERGGERGARVACPVAVVLAFSAEHEAVEAAGLPDGGEAVDPAGKKLVDIRLMADVKEDFVFGCGEDGVQRQRQLDYTEIRPKVAAGL
jgi:histone H3/H4